MINFDVLDEEKLNEWHCLKETKEITVSDLESEFWQHLERYYDRYTDPKGVVKGFDLTVKRITVSICNAIVHQQRHVFKISQKHIRKLVQNDQNWVKRGVKIRFDSKKWKAIIKAFCALELTEAIIPSNRNMYFIVSDKKLQGMLRAEDRSKQVVAMEKFVQ